MYYLNQTPVAETPPANLTASTPPSWHRVSGGHEYELARRQAARARDGRADARRRRSSAGGRSRSGSTAAASAIAGGLYHADNPSIVWFWPIVVLLACVLAAWRIGSDALDARLARVLAIVALVVDRGAAPPPSSFTAARPRSVRADRVRGDRRVRRLGPVAGRCPVARATSCCFVIGFVGDRGRARAHPDAAARVRPDRAAGVPCAQPGGGVPGNGDRPASVRVPDGGPAYAERVPPTTTTSSTRRTTVLGAWPDRPAPSDRCAGLRGARGRALGCGSSAPTPSTDGSAVPADLLAQARPIGRGARFQPPATGPVVGTCKSKLGARVGVHVELFAANRVVLIAAGIGTRPPLRYSAGRIASARCYGDLVTLEPTGVVLVRRGAAADARGPVSVVGQPLSTHRLASFSAAPGQSVRVFVNGRPWSGPPGRVPLSAALGDRARGRASRAAAPLLHVPARDLSPGAIFQRAKMSGPLQRGALIRRLAPLALMPAAAFAVHQLRYWLAFGGHAGLFLDRQGHLYLHSLAPWIVVAVAIAIGAFLQALGRALGGQRLAVSPHALVHRAVAALRSRSGRDLHAPRSSSRGCLRPGTRPDWSASSDTAAGGRCRRRSPSAWCSPQCSTALGGRCRRSPSADPARPGFAARAFPCRARLTARRPPGWRRSPTAGRTAARLAEAAPAPLTLRTAASRTRSRDPRPMPPPPRSNADADAACAKAPSDHRREEHERESQNPDRNASRAERVDRRRPRAAGAGGRLGARARQPGGVGEGRAAALQPGRADREGERDDQQDRDDRSVRVRDRLVRAAAARLDAASAARPAPAKTRSSRR